MDKVKCFRQPTPSHLRAMGSISTIEYYSAIKRMKTGTDSQTSKTNYGYQRGNVGGEGQIRSLGLANIYY